MRKSRVLQKLRAGEVVSCLKINLSDPRVSEIAAITGFDCVWADQEHIGSDWSILAGNVWATKCHDTDLLVRVPRGSYSDYVRPLELDATGIMVPHIMNLEEAKKVVEVTRFHPIGRRPIDGGNADGSYTALDFNEYLVQANEQRFVILQIEDPEPLAQLDEIAALEGYDMLFFGPGDFSQGIGSPGQWDHPDLVAARKKVAEAARKHGKFAGTVGGPGNLQELIDMGYQFVSVGADVVGLKNYCQDLLKAFDPQSAGKAATSYLENE
ncbi:4-hydroxy-2-oxoheptanedioate aldolase [Dyadobacter jejuensis]|uniref:4-hydroxy-2-oxoheptanedioate aldolase n=1 Tax=Dyadobacter jejuensis TaxID=1082580 RepID=A0A316AN05_9BACT|nr:aldolase/citrate lyase family protein [Dyadobacter jejuensis]PWJ58160.1 4-hydroxy-2-oxoheptanedioate aldolase [Dyadobacter jejuensis]